MVNGNGTTRNPRGRRQAPKSGPSLREQAAAHRATKGTREERLVGISEQAQKAVGRAKGIKIISPEMKRNIKINAAVTAEMKRQGVPTYQSGAVYQRMLEVQKGIRNRKS